MKFDIFLMNLFTNCKNRALCGDFFMKDIMIRALNLVE